MPRLLSTDEIIDIRERVHPGVHDDTCEVCSVFSTMAAMVLLIDIRADFDPNQPRDDDGKWTSSGGGDSGGSDSAIVPLSDSQYPANTGSVDEKVAAAVETKAVAQALTDHPDNETLLKNTNEAPIISLALSTLPASSAKAMVTDDIAGRLETKYDTQLLGNNGGVAVTSLLTEDDLWMKVKTDIDPNGPMRVRTTYNYFGKTNSLSDKWSTGLLANGDAVLGNDPALLPSLRADAISNLVSRWAETSHNSSVVSIAMQESATKEFNLTGIGTWDESENTDEMNQDLAQSVQSELTKNGDMYQAFLRAQYDSTQQFFKDNGISQVTAYRGFKFDGEYNTQLTPDEQVPGAMPSWAVPEEQDDFNDDGNTWNADIPLRPLSSFSYDPNQASNFAGSGYTDTGRMIAGVVPVSRVLSTAVTGNGCLNEREMVLLGGTDKWTVR